MIFIQSCTFSEPEFPDGLGPLPQEIDFNIHVRSILSENCFACHGPDVMTREADFRLDTEEGAFAPLNVSKGSYAIVKGEPGKSELYKRITSDDPDYMMPTPGSNLALTDREIAILRRWIEQGADYQPHWSFIPPKKPELPQVKNVTWPKSPIDYFILHKLEENGLEPSPNTSKENLLRRVSFDLTGLPPTIYELKEFLADSSVDAYERAVDRLLNSEAYGERMAVEWLDVARYADTHGYQQDGPNEMWPWREWVIKAFNRNMPFDQFTTWQLAGDLLPDKAREQQLATGFNRVHQQNQEGGIISEEYRVEYVADRVYTTGTTFLGITMQCARCHDHKYDPVSEVEYYEFSAFFDNVNDTGQIPGVGASGPTILLPDNESEQLIAYLDDQISSKEQDLDVLKTSKVDEFHLWQEQLADTDWIKPEISSLIAHLDMDVVEEDSIIIVKAGEEERAQISGELNQIEGKYGGALEFSHGNFINLGKNTAQFERTDPFSFSFWIKPTDTFNEVPVLTKSGSVYIGYRGYDISLFNNQISLRLMHGWPYNAIQVISQDTLSLDQWSHVVITYDGSSNANGVEMYVNGDKQQLHIEHNDLFKNIVIGDYEERYPTQNFMIGHRSSHENLNYRGLGLDEIKIYNRRLSGMEAFLLSGREDLSEIIALASEEMSEHQQNILFDHYLHRLDPDVKVLADKLRDLRVEKSAVTDTIREVMVMKERLNPRQTYVRERGMYDQLGEKVSPDVPESIMKFPENLPRNRLGLAQWILHPDNPLTSRVIVNRFWQVFFGQGLVNTPDDFGNQGSLPSHPELLDWLAVTFRESWDVKDLIKQIVMSRTYMQSSLATPELRDRDPENRLLARGPRYRMSAEMIRDNALLASGLLISKIGGPSTFPYQPEGLWEELGGQHMPAYVQGKGDDLYRRSVYTFFRRTSPPPGMMTFDAAPRSHPVVKREETSTPLQALHTLNDPIYIETSRVLAERMMTKGGKSIDEQITYAFLALTSRYPEDWEREELRSLYLKELQRFKEEPERAQKLLKVGEFPADFSLEATELAAGTIIANTILNLDETLTKK